MEMYHLRTNLNKQADSLLTWICLLQCL